MRLLEVRMSLSKARIICFKSSYLAGNEPDLRSNSILWRAGCNHPVEVINVLLECLHQHWNLNANAKVSDGSQPPRALSLYPSESAGSRSLYRLVGLSVSKSYPRRESLSPRVSAGSRS
jgi:hypothetical protein